MSKQGLPPLLCENPRILVLGSLPGDKSIEMQQYYGHPRNRFWPLIAALTGESLPQSIEEKKALLLRHHIAMWDVAESCVIEGSGDNSICEVTPVRIRELTGECQLEAVFANGQTAWSLYMEYLYPLTEMPCVKLPSTSPANAAVKPEVLLKKWGDALLPYLREEGGEA